MDPDMELMLLTTEPDPTVEQWVIRAAGALGLLANMTKDGFSEQSVTVWESLRVLFAKMPAPLMMAAGEYVQKTMPHLFFDNEDE